MLLFTVGMAGCGGSGTSNQGGAPSQSLTYPVRPSANGRFLVDQNNTPFLLTGDSPQSLIANLSESEAKDYFAGRQSLGFNAVWLNVLCSKHTGGRADGSTYDGILPFNTPGDIATPNPDYFGRVDAMIRLASQYQMLVFLNPAETIDWLSVLRSNGESKAQEYGRFLGTRYRAFDNIVWLSGNDFQTWQNPSDTAVVQAVAQGIRAVDNRHIQTVLLNFYCSSSLNDPSWRPVIQLDAAYTYFPTYAEILKEYNRSDFLPVILLESNYEFENEGKSTQVLRQQEYWALLSGACGQFYGSLYIWQFVPGWQNQLRTPGALQVGYLKSMLATRAWYDLIPDQNHSFVTSGYGAYSASSKITDNNYVTAAITPDGSFAIAYLPVPQTISVNTSRLAGLSHAQWFDPTNGSFLNISSSISPSNGTVQFMPPAANSEGSCDWVLLIEKL